MDNESKNMTTNTYDNAIKNYSTARGYVQSIFLIATNERRYQANKDTPFILASMLLAGFAVELYLKAYLQRSGFKESIKTHDLRKLSHLCEKRGLPASKMKDLVDFFYQSHRDGLYRYMRGEHEYEVPKLHILFNLLSDLNNIVDEALGARASYGLEIDGQWNFPEKNNWRY